MERSTAQYCALHSMCSALCVGSRCRPCTAGKTRQLDGGEVQEESHTEWHQMPRSMFKESARQVSRIGLLHFSDRDAASTSRHIIHSLTW